MSLLHKYVNEIIKRIVISCPACLQEKEQEKIGLICSKEDLNETLEGPPRHPKYKGSKTLKNVYINIFLKFSLIFTIGQW